ncbi:MAG: putative Fe-S cluster assembly protein SufT [Pseudomonadota bacterium]
MTDPHNYNEPVTVIKDCDAILIPEGSNITLKEGTTVYITQALGGSVTVNVNGMLARIAARDVEAIGLERSETPVDGAVAAADGSVDESLIWEQLKTCYDPEIPIDVVELGLIYRCEVEKTEAKENTVNIDMTLTAPGCGMGPFLVDDVQSKVAEVPNVNHVNVELVFDPPWNPEMMSEAARLQTGLY